MCNEHTNDRTETNAEILGNGFVFFRDCRRETKFGFEDEEVVEVQAAARSCEG
jgi:hypothetical protein